MKKVLGHGQFGAWLKAEFGWSGRTARRFMQAAEIFGAKMDSVSVLDPSVLYLLSAPSTPDQVRKYVLALLEHGRALPAADIRKLVGRAHADLPSLKGSIAAFLTAVRKAAARRLGVRDYLTQVDDILVEIAGGQFPKPFRTGSMEPVIQTVVWVTVMRDACHVPRARVMELVDLVFPAPPVGYHAAENGTSDRVD